jgi:hypothetical protein
MAQRRACSTWLTGDITTNDIPGQLEVDTRMLHGEVAAVSHGEVGSMVLNGGIYRGGLSVLYRRCECCEGEQSEHRKPPDVGY